WAIRSVAQNANAGVLDLEAVEGLRQEHEADRGCRVDAHRNVPAAEVGDVVGVRCLLAGKQAQRIDVRAAGVMDLEMHVLARRKAWRAAEAEDIALGDLAALGDVDAGKMTIDGAVAVGVI